MILLYFNSLTHTNLTSYLLFSYYRIFRAMTDMNTQPNVSTASSTPSIVELKNPRAKRTNRPHPYHTPHVPPLSYTELTQPYHVLFQPPVQYNLQPPPYTYQQAELQQLIHTLENHLVSLAITIQQLKGKINHE